MRLTGAKIGSLIGCVGALTFILVNAGALAPPWPVVLRVLGVVAFAVVVALVLRARVIGRGEEPTRGQLRAYGWTVLAEVVAIMVGARVLAGPLDRPAASLPWVALVLGVHFVVFTPIFREPVFTWIGAPVVVCGLVGLGLAVGGADRASIALVSALLTGAIMLTGIAFSAWQGRPAATPVR